MILVGCFQGGTTQSPEQGLTVTSAHCQEWLLSYGTVEHWSEEFTGDGATYRGVQQRTVSFRTCKDWSETVAGYRKHVETKDVFSEPSNLGYHWGKST